MKLNLGCCGHKLDNWINIDFHIGVQPDMVADVRKLPFADGSVDEIFAGHILEHFAWDDPVLSEWFRVLKPLGKITVCVPDVNRASTMAEDGQISKEWLTDLVFGMPGGKLPGTAHFRAYTRRLLQDELIAAGFRGTRHLDPRYVPLLNSGVIEQLVMEAVKPG